MITWSYYLWNWRVLFLCCYWCVEKFRELVVFLDEELFVGGEGGGQEGELLG